jgi:hypothetical protein
MVGNQQETGDEQSKWESRIARDLDYIKTNKRYRWNIRISMPLIVYGMLFLLIICLLILTFKDADSKKLSSILFPFIAFASFGIVIYKYLQSLRFIDVKTGLNNRIMI